MRMAGAYDDKNEHGKSPSLAASLVEALRLSAKGNSHTAASAAAVLWPDKERQWQAALPLLRRLVPGLFELGSYNPHARSGPAVWLKCAIAGVLPEIRVPGRSGRLSAGRESRGVACHRELPTEPAAAG